MGTRKPMTEGQRKQKRRGLVAVGALLLAGGAIANALFRGAYMPPARVSAGMSADEQLAAIKKASAQSRSVRLEGRTARAVYTGKDLQSTRRGATSTTPLYRIPMAEGVSLLCIGEVPDGDVTVLPKPAPSAGGGSNTVDMQLRSLSGHGVILRVQGAGARELRMALLASPLVGGVGIMGYLWATRRRRDEPATGFAGLSAAGV